jgi:hypothetical protein
MVLLAGLLGPVAVAQSQPWRVCLPDAAFPPYLLNDAEQLGVSEKLMREAGRRAGLEVQFTRLPIARCRALVQQGELDAFITPDAAATLPGLRFPRLGEAVDAARRLVEVRFLFVQRDDADWRWDGQALQAFPSAGRVGLRQGYLGGVGAVRALGLSVDQSGSSATQVLGMLRLRRVEAAVLMDVEMDGALRQAGAEGLRVLPQPLRQERYYAAVSQSRDATLAEAWWRQIGLLRDTAAFRP